MQRVDNDPTDLFENGNPATGIEGTRLMAEWLNAIQEEVCFVIEEAGLTLDTGDDTQLHEALGIDFNDIPSGEKILFYKNTAVVGYSLLDTLDDKVVYVTKGSAAGGQTGGTVHSSGTWTQPAHTLTAAESGLRDHAHIMSCKGAISSEASGFVVGVNPETDIDTGLVLGGALPAISAHNHGSAWRPSAYNFTVQQRN